MSKIRGIRERIRSKKKKTRQGNGKFSKAPHSGGETFYNNCRSGSPPAESHKRKKPYRRQGK